MESGVWTQRLPPRCIGSVTVNSQSLNAGDALMTDGGAVEIERGKEAEVLLFDLPDD